MFFAMLNGLRADQMLWWQPSSVVGWAVTAGFSSGLASWKSLLPPPGWGTTPASARTTAALGAPTATVRGTSRPAALRAPTSGLAGSIFTWAVAVADLHGTVAASPGLITWPSTSRSCT